MSASQTYTINGVKLVFPCKAYPSQLSMMDKIIKGIDRQQNCLLESPTGSGKSLALLCSALAWQAAEREKMRQEESMQADHACCCRCHNATDSGAVYPSVDVTVSSTSHQQQLAVAANLDSVHCIPNVDREKCEVIISENESESDEDFQTSKKKLHTNRKQAAKSSAAEVDSPTKWVMEVENDNSLKAASCECSCSEKVGKTKRKLPKVYFGTRTHKQVAQVVREMGKTAYNKTRMTILSSREHTCIHPEVMKSSNRNEECKNLLDGYGCRFNERVKRVFSHSNLETRDLGAAWDIEDLVTFAKKQRACPYFGARQLRDTADIVFCPYNYLVDPAIRKSMDIVLTNQVVILDEAHNIEDSSREAASFAVMQDQLMEAANNLRIVANIGEKQMEYRSLAQMCEDLTSMIENQKMLLENGEFEGACQVWTGVEIVAQMERVGITASRLKELERLYSSVSEKSAEEEKRGQSAEIKMTAATSTVLDGLFLVIGFIYNENFKFIDDYRVAIMKIYTYVNVPTNNRWLGKRRGNMRATWAYQLNFWCMNPAVAFTDMSEKVRCVILTSGTLSPMTSFQSELGVVFPIQLEANHVIGNSQVWIATISRGLSNQSLLGSFQNAETLGYQDEIGEIVLRVCQTVPYGVLCFLPSYKSMEKLMSRWKETGTIVRMSKSKIVLREPRASDKESFDEILKEFYEAIRSGHVEGEANQGTDGALLFAVCRGKVSEGLDFADNNARAVITIGIPFPNIKDTQVLQKKKYNDAKSHTKGLLCGAEWYEIQAYRALNQALGRCIRHRHDWGALILVDERFGKNPQKYTSGLSKWVRQRMQYYGDFQNAMNSLKHFTQDRLNSTASDETSFISTQSLNSTAFVTPKKMVNQSLDETLNVKSPPEHQDESVSELYSGHNQVLTSTPVTAQQILPKQNARTTAVEMIPNEIPLAMVNTFSVTAFQKVPGYRVPTENDQVTLNGANCGQVNENVIAAVNPKGISRFFNISQAGGFLPTSSQLPLSLAAQPERKRQNIANVTAEVIIDTTSDEVLQQKTIGEEQILRTNNELLNSSFPMPLDFRVPGPQLDKLTSEKSTGRAFDHIVLHSVSQTNELKEPEKENRKNAADIEIKSAADIEISAFMSVDSNKMHDLKSSSLRQESPDLFESVPTEIGSEEINAVLEELGVDKIQNIKWDKSLSCSKKDSTTLKPSADAEIQPKSKVELNGNGAALLNMKPGTSFAEMVKVEDCILWKNEENLTDDNSDFQCSQLPKKKRRDRKPSLMEAENCQQSTKKMKMPPSCEELESHNMFRNELEKQSLSSASTAEHENANSIKNSERKDVEGLVSRKSARIRQKKSFGDHMLTFKATRSKGVDFLEEISLEEHNGGTNDLQCPVCQAVLTADAKPPSSYVTKEMFTPSFGKEFFKDLKSSFITLDKSHLQMTALCLKSNDQSDGCNSYWSETDGCCVQLLFCSSCQAAKKSTCLGTEVKALAKVHAHRLRANQVWLTSNCLNGT